MSLGGWVTPHEVRVYMERRPVQKFTAICNTCDFRFTSDRNDIAQQRAAMHRIDGVKAPVYKNPLKMLIAYLEGRKKNV